MSDYTITTNFGAKDSLPSGNAGKVIKGSEFTTEFTNIKTAVNTKADTAGDTFTGVVNFSADVAVNTNTLFVDVSTARVGIGTDSPAYKLDVTGSAQLSGGDLILRSDSVNADTQSIRFENSSDDTRSAYIRADYATNSSGNATSLVFGTNPSTSDGSNRMVIDASGNVGIGTDTPDSALEVQGSTNGVHQIHIQNIFDDDNADDPNPSARLYLSAASNNAYIQCKGAPTDLGTQHEIDLGSTAANSFLTFSPSASEKMRIDASGNVGIGTTSPDSFLTIDKDVSTAYDSSSDDAQRSNTNTLLLKNEDGTANSFAQIAFDLGANDQPIARIAGINTGTSSSALAFVVEGSNVKREAMRIDSSGNVLVGTTDSSVYDSTSGGNTGFVYSPNGFLQVARQTTTNAQSVMNLNKMGADGNIIELYKDGTAVGSISVRNTDNLTIEGNSTHSGLSFGTNELLPFKNGAYIDSTLNIGSTTFKFKDIYRSGSTYSTSDRNKKQDIRDLTDAEARVAVVAKGSLKAFRYIDTVEAEGADANIHFGIIAQDLKAAFEAEGLNADSYQVLKTSTYTDDDGVEQTTYSVCYENLLAFIISAI